MSDPMKLNDDVMRSQASPASSGHIAYTSPSFKLTAIAEVIAGSSGTDIDFGTLKPGIEGAGGSQNRGGKPTRGRG